MKDKDDQSKALISPGLAFPKTTFEHPVNVERKKTMSCYLCGQETETYVVDCGERGPHGECYFKKKVPLCEGCFRELYPSQENIQKLSFWLHIFPSIDKVQTT